jgi:integrase
MAMATIRKRSWKSGGESKTAWVCDYADQDGTRRLKTFKTRKEADNYLVGARAQVAAGTHTADSASATITAAAELWLERCEVEGLEPQTIRTYRNNARHHVLPLLGTERLSRLTAPVVERFRDELLRSRSREMARKALTTLKMIIGDAQRRGLVAQNVARGVSIRNNGRHKEPVAIPSKAEIKALLDAAAPRWRALLVTAVFTGLRASELRGLTWGDVDLDAMVIRVRQRADRWDRIGALKSAAGRREIPLAPMVLNALREVRLASPRGGLDLVFPNGAGKVESLANIWNRGLAPAQVAAGIVGPDGKAKYGLHALRHFFASWLIDQGFGPKRVQALMGHSGIQITLDTYTHLWPQEDDHERFAAGELALVG